jgi:uncharacterized protein involved in high-affinity Fe2+ transport
VLKRHAGTLVTLAIISGAILILVLNLEPTGSRLPAPPPPSEKTAIPSATGLPASAAGFREYPIGDEVEQSGLRIAAVWLPPIHMAGMKSDPGTDMIHLEADIHALEANINGFGKDEFVPYLKVTYQIIPSEGGATLEGEMGPMVARDGLHYGANIATPRPGNYRLVYQINPPSAVLGRHDDPITGVAPWWEPFEVSFDWTFDGLPDDKAKTGAG